MTNEYELADDNARIQRGTNYPAGVTSAELVGARRRNIAALDAIRGVAALLVVLGHSRSMVLSSHGLPKTGDGWQRVALFPTGFAVEAVAVFFVLSGYLVGGQVLSGVRAGKFSWREYFARRMSRLYVVLVPGIAVTLAIGYLLRRFTSSASVFDVEHSEPAGRVLCHMVFLEDIRCRTLGSNGSLWSLSYEFWFYITFAAAAVAVASLVARRWASLLINVTVLVASGLIFGYTLLLLFPVWLFGAVLALWQSSRPPADASRVAVMASGALVLCAAITTSILAGLPIEVTFAVVGLAALPLIHLMTCRSPLWETGTIRQAARLGGWSFTLYVFHGPVVALICTLMISWTLTPITAVLTAYAVALIATLLCYPAIFIGERHTLRVRSLLLNRSNASMAVCEVRGRRT